jgi:hypothetical protein
VSWTGPSRVIHIGTLNSCDPPRNDRQRFSAQFTSLLASALVKNALIIETTTSIITCMIAADDWDIFSPTEPEFNDTLGRNR